MNHLHGFFDTEEMRIRTSWEQTRWQTAAMLNVYAKRGQSIKPADLIRFPWEEDKKEIVQGLDKAAFMELAEKRWAKWDAEMKN